MAARTQTVMHVVTGETIHLRIRTRTRLEADTGCPRGEETGIDVSIRDCRGQLVHRERNAELPALWHGGSAYRDEDMLWACRWYLLRHWYRTGVPLTGHATDGQALDYVLGTLQRGGFRQTAHRRAA